MKRWRVTGRIGAFSTVTVEVEGIDWRDAYKQAYREIGDPRVVWVDCRELS